MTPEQRQFLLSINESLVLIKKIFKSHGLKIEFKIEDEK
jgi:hypothetical protein